MCLQSRRFRPVWILACALCWAMPAPGLRAQTPAGEPKRITVSFQDVSLREALEQLFKAARAQYTIDNSVEGTVTLSMTDQPLDSALRLLLRSANPPLTYTVENNVYLVRRGRLSAPAVALAALAPAAETRRPETARIAESVGLLYVKADETITKLRALPEFQETKFPDLLNDKVLNDLKITLAREEGQVAALRSLYGEGAAERREAEERVSNTRAALQRRQGELQKAADSVVGLLASPNNKDIVVTGTQEQCQKVREVVRLLDLKK